MTAVQIPQVTERCLTRCLVVTMAALLAACAAPAPGTKKAPVVEYGIGDKRPSPVAPQKPIEISSQSYVVQKGDTLYSIAFLHGVDYRDVAELNNLKDPSAIQIGQLLRLNVPTAEPLYKPEAKPAVIQQPVQMGGVKNQPKVGRLAYSETALAKAESMQADTTQTNPATTAVVAATTTRPTTTIPSREEGEGDAMEWGMPTFGKMISGFSESDNRKGVDIVGQRGQSVVASASGKVVYSGSGLRGYGKLIIIKHNKTFLSAYAHNDQILVKEGQNVNKGQKIAEMGNTDADQVKLHFEIRKLGKPVDPAKYLPLVKS